MFSDDLRQRIDKVEKEVDSLKSMQVDIARITLSISHLSEKMDGLEKRLDNKIDGLEKNLGDKIDGLDKRLSRIKVGIIGFLTIILGSTFSIIVLPYLKAKYF